MQLSEQLAQYLQTVYQEALAPTIRERAKAFLGDTFAVMMAGSTEPAALLAAE